MKAKKSFGQHFLINKSLARSIVDLAIAESKGGKILEVGPGKAALTKYLIEYEVDFIAVDADREMISFLQEGYPDLQERFLLTDFLKLDLDNVNGGKPLLVLGNFPYNISSQIIFKLIDHVQIVPTIIGMFQKEVADRIVAPHGSKTFGVISLLIQYFYNCKIVFKVSPGSFSPPPKVQSAVVRFQRRRETPPCDYKLFKQITKQAFSQRRKMMRNTLKPIITNPALLKDAIFNNRPEQLSLDQFVELTNIIEKSKTTS